MLDVAMLTLQVAFQIANVVELDDAAAAFSTWRNSNRTGKETGPRIGGCRSEAMVLSQLHEVGVRWIAGRLLRHAGVRVNCEQKRAKAMSVSLPVGLLLEWPLPSSDAIRCSTGTTRRSTQCNGKQGPVQCTHCGCHCRCRAQQRVTSGVRFRDALLTADHVRV